jgi:hypothetical protein
MDLIFERLSKIETKIENIITNGANVKNDNKQIDEFRASKGSQFTHSKIGD